MQSSVRDDYLTTEVMTAPPQKIQLMLIDTAIRSAERARAKWRAKEEEQALEALIHAQRVVSEMLAGLNPDADPELAERVAAVYTFVFRNLMEANYQHDEEKLDDALRVLAIERETWRQVCEQLGSAKPCDEQGASGFSLQA